MVEPPPSTGGPAPDGPGPGQPGSDGPPAPAAADLHRWSASLAAIARTGLAFTTNPFEVERYEEILAVAADIRVSADHLSDELTPDETVAPDDLRASWLRQVGSRVPGYVTPKVAVGAVVGNDQGRLLLIQRADSGVWLYPTGWADVGYSPSEVVIKEVREETGISCRVVRPLAIVDGLRAGFSRVPLYSLVFLCRAIGGELAPHPHECLDAGWFAEDDLPSPLANYDLWGRHAFRALAAGDHIRDRDAAPDDRVWFDPPRDPVWRGDPGGGDRT